MTDNTQTENTAAPAIQDAGEGYLFIVAKTDAGRFQVFARDPHYCDGAFYPWHPNGIRRAGADAMGKWVADKVRKHLAELKDPESHPCADVELENTLSGNATIAEDFDAAAALLPFLKHAPDPWKLAEEIACARPWQMQGRDLPDDVPSDDIPF
ncbi:hypothetical protein [Roseovarius sp. SYSU LYC5161]|uniref:hypothetical protein n=1 Tax=Roseovarius halophilus (ex Wu et al. 2025) TaxID=3376060 RepID=UPI00399BE505